MKYRLQQYQDGTFGYFKFDGDENINFKTKSKVVCTQGADEDREDFIQKNNLSFQTNQYGSNLDLDIQLNSGWTYKLRDVAIQGYGLDWLMTKNYDNHIIKCGIVEGAFKEKRTDLLDILVYDKFSTVRAEIAHRGYGLDILAHDIYDDVRIEVAKQGYKAPMDIDIDKIVKILSETLNAKAKKSIWAIALSEYRNDIGNWVIEFIPYFKVIFHEEHLSIEFDGVISGSDSEWGPSYKVNNRTLDTPYNKHLLKMKEDLFSKNIDTIFYRIDENLSDIFAGINANTLNLLGPKLEGKSDNEPKVNRYVYDLVY